MAIQKSTDTHHGFTCPNAYYMVKSVSLQKDEQVRVQVFVYKDETARQNNDSTIDSIGLEFEYDLLSTDNILVQSYNALKIIVPDGIDV